MQLETFLVERYLPGRSLADFVGSLGRLKSESDRLAAAGTPVRYLGTLVMAGDESCLCRFEARSPEAVIQANQAAEAPFARVVDGEWLAADTLERRSQ